MKILLILSMLISCNNFLMKPSLLRAKPNTITVLTAAKSGVELDKSDSKYFADKLTENLMSDSTGIFDRSLINAYEISHKLEGRYAISPKEFEELHNYFKSDYYLLSQIKFISKTPSAYKIEVEVRVLNASQKIIRIKSLTFEEDKITNALKKAAKSLANHL